MRHFLEMRHFLAFRAFRDFPPESWKVHQLRVLVELGKTFRAFREKRRGTHRETPMEYGLSAFRAFRP